VYDLVLQRTFGPALRGLTDATVQVVRELVSPPASVVDFGAGTGRVSLPLSELGYHVTAVDPSAAMLARLAKKERTGASVTRVVAPLEKYRGVGDQDLALCVFSVLGYVLDEQRLAAAFRGVGSALRPGGFAVVDIPGPEALEGFEVESEDVLRHVEIEPVPEAEGLHAYRERAAVRRGVEVKRFEESFLIRAWERRKVVDAAGAAGIVLAEDITPRFEGWGADYLLFRRSD
jgi:SAM-dependent methyltransferase